MSEMPPAPRTARAFWPTAGRLLRELTRWPGRLSLMTALLVSSVLLTVLAPRVLGHATDLIYAGVVGLQSPAGADAEQVIAGLREQGRDQMADMLTAVDFTPGQGIDFPALGATLLLVLGMYVLAGVFLWLEGRILNDLVMRVVRDVRR